MGLIDKSLCCKCLHNQKRQRKVFLEKVTPKIRKIDLRRNTFFEKLQALSLQFYLNLTLLQLYGKDILNFQGT